MPHKQTRKCFDLGRLLGQLTCELSRASDHVDAKKGTAAKTALKGAAIRASDAAMGGALAGEQKKAFTNISEAARKLANRVGRKKRIPKKLAEEALEKINQLSRTAHTTAPKECL